MAGGTDQTPGSDLLALPPEILLQIFDFLRQDGDTKVLRNSLLVCRDLQGVAESALYHTIAFRKRSSLHILAKALTADPRRLRYIQDLELQWSTKDYKHGELQPPDLAAMLNLRQLLSESPECQPWASKGGRWKSDMQNCLDAFEQASLRNPLSSSRPLQNLISVTLHWSGDNERFWSVKPSCPIFLHPTMRSLKISCISIARLEQDDAEWDAGMDAFRSQTDLESLIFEESFVSPLALKKILSLPRALRNFEFEEISHHRPNFANFLKELIGSDVGGFNEALAQQAHSLERLRIKGSSYLRSTRTAPADIVLSLGEFRNLTFLEIGSFPVGRRSPPWMLSWPVPPNLTELCLTGFGPEDSHTVEKTILSMLRVNELNKNATAHGHKFLLDIKLPSVPFWHTVPLEADLPQIEAILTALKDTIGPSAGEREMASEAPIEEASEGVSAEQRTPVHLTISSIKIMGHYIPPYLHGEKRPKTTVLFDTERGFSREMLDSIRERVLEAEYEAEEWETDEEDEDDDVEIHTYVQYGPELADIDPDESSD